MKATIAILAPLALAGILTILPRPALEPGSSYREDWQQVPMDIQRTADKLDLGLEVHPLDLERFDAFMEEIQKND